MRTLLLLVPLLVGCGRYCTLMYAPSHLTVEFEADAWAPGTWDVELVGGGAEATCTVTLPLVDGASPECSDFATLQVNAAGDAIDALSVTDIAPDTFTVRVYDDEGLVAQQQFSPEYAVDEPNGEGCGERRVATVTMTL